MSEPLTARLAAALTEEAALGQVEVTAMRASIDAVVEMEARKGLSACWAEVPSKILPITVRLLEKDGYHVTVNTAGLLWIEW